MHDLTGFAAVLLDLDGVLTHTADQHFQAWKATFDDLLRRHHGRTFEPFTHDDYHRHVDGMARRDGVRQFVASRGLALAEGTPDDPNTVDTVNGVAARKNELVNQLIRDQGVEVYPDAVTFLRQARADGRGTAVVSASRNCATVLEAAGISDLFDVRVDGITAAERGLVGKPAPDTFLHAAAQLDLEPRHCVVVEDALAGVEAGRAGGFGLVVGVNRADRADALRRHGADVVVAELTELLP